MFGHQTISSLDELTKTCAKGDVPADVVVKAFMQKIGYKLDANNVGRLGVLLARYSFFGDGILHESTLKGKGKRPALDPTILNSLMVTVHSKHPISLLFKGIPKSYST